MSALQSESSWDSEDDGDEEEASDDDEERHALWDPSTATPARGGGGGKGGRRAAGSSEEPGAQRRRRRRSSTASGGSGALLLPEEQPVLTHLNELLRQQGKEPVGKPTVGAMGWVMGQACPAQTLAACGGLAAALPRYACAACLPDAVHLY